MSFLSIPIRRWFRHIAWAGPLFDVVRSWKKRNVGNLALGGWSNHSSFGERREFVGDRIWRVVDSKAWLDLQFDCTVIEVLGPGGGVGLVVLGIFIPLGSPQLLWPSRVLSSHRQLGQSLHHSTILRSESHQSWGVKT